MPWSKVQVLPIDGDTAFANGGRRAATPSKSIHHRYPPEDRFLASCRSEPKANINGSCRTGGVVADERVGGGTSCLLKSPLFFVCTKSGNNSH